MTHYQKVDVDWDVVGGDSIVLFIDGELANDWELEFENGNYTIRSRTVGDPGVFDPDPVNETFGSLDEAKTHLLEAYNISSGALNPRGLARLEVDFGKEARDLLLADIDRFQQWVNDLQAGCYINCVYCGHRYGPDDEVPASMADVLKEHIEQCPEHPLSHAKARIEELEETGLALVRELRVWMSFLARDVGTDRIEDTMKGFPAVVALEQRFRLAAGETP